MWLPRRYSPLVSAEFLIAGAGSTPFAFPFCRLIYFISQSFKSSITKSIKRVYQRRITSLDHKLITALTSSNHKIQSHFRATKLYSNGRFAPTTRVQADWIFSINTLSKHAYIDLQWRAAIPAYKSGFGITVIVYHSPFFPPITTFWTRISIGMFGDSVWRCQVLPYMCVSLYNSWGVPTAFVHAHCIFWPLYPESFAEQFQFVCRGIDECLAIVTVCTVSIRIL